MVNIRSYLYCFSSFHATYPGLAGFYSSFRKIVSNLARILSTAGFPVHFFFFSHCFCTSILEWILGFSLDGYSTHYWPAGSNFNGVGLLHGVPNFPIHPVWFAVRHWSPELRLERLVIPWTAVVSPWNVKNNFYLHFNSLCTEGSFISWVHLSVIFIRPPSPSN